MINFNLSNVSGVSTKKPMLKPFGIYDVTLTSIEGQTFNGKKDPSKTYKVLKVRFDGKEGYYSESIFYPVTAEDAKRTEFNNVDKDGKPYTSYGASNFDKAMIFVAQLGQTINPEGWKKVQEISSKFKTFDDVVNALIKITSKEFGKFTTQLKLVGRVKDGQMQACLPSYCKINRDKEAYVADNFIGENLGFSAYEESKRNLYLNATPTSMDSNDIDKSSQDLNVKDSSSDLDDFDLDDLGI